MNLKAFIKWSDIALSLRELFNEVRESFNKHDERLTELQKQNLLLLQRISYHDDLIQSLQNRVEFLEQKNMATGNSGFNNGGISERGNMSKKVIDD